MESVNLNTLGPSGIEFLEHLSKSTDRIALRVLPAPWRDHDLLHWCIEKELIRLQVMRMGGFTTATEILGYTQSWGPFQDYAFQPLREALALDEQRAEREGIHVCLTRFGLAQIVECRLALKSGVPNDLPGSPTSGNQEINIRAPAKPIKAVDASLVYDVSISHLRYCIRKKSLVDYRPPNAASNHEIILDEVQVALRWAKRIVG